MQMYRVYERIFQEATKRRFIEPIWDKYLQYGDDGKEIMRHTKYPSRDLPDADAVIKWVDSGAADKYKIDWNIILKSTPDNPGEFGRLVDAYYDYEDNNEKVKRSNPTVVFKHSGLNYNTESNPDFLYLGESDKFLFIGVCTYNAAVFCDSFKCGGAGATWCIGTYDDNKYWLNYNYKNHMFVIAYNKTTFGDAEEQKYMLELYKESDELRATVWNQPDIDIIHCVGIEDWWNFSAIFGIEKEDCERFFNKVFEIVQFKAVDVFSIKDIIENHNVINVRPQRVIQLSDFDVRDFDYSQLLGRVKGLDQIQTLNYKPSEKENLYYDSINMGPKNISNYNSLRHLDQYPAINFKDCGDIYIRDLWISTYSRGLFFVDCGKITIDMLHLPAYGVLLDWVSKNGTKDLGLAIRKYALELSLPNCEIKNIIFSPSATYCNSYPAFAFNTRAVPNSNLPVLISSDEIQSGIPRDVSDAKRYITIDFRNQLSLFKSDKFDISDVIKNVTRNTPVIRAINVPESKQVYWSDQSLYPDISFDVYTVPEHK